MFKLGKVVFEPGTWEAIPSSILLRALELHSCGVFGKLELYEIQNNFENVRRLEKYAASVGPRFWPAQALVDAAKSGKKFYSKE